MERTDHLPEQETGAAAPPPLSDAIARLMAQPELLSMVASALGAPAPTAAAPSDGETAAEVTPSSAESETKETPPVSEESTPAVSPASASLPDLIATLAPLLGGGKGLPTGGGGHRGKEDDRTCLLRALKPYLSPGRREAIETMIRLSVLSDTLKHLG